MIKEEDFDAAKNVSSDMAFVRLERKFREVLERNLENSQNNTTYDNYIEEYMNHAAAAAKKLGVAVLQNWERPARGAKELYPLYQDFTAEIDYFAVQVQIDHIRAPVTDSVALDEKEKRVVRHHVEQIKEVIGASPLVDAKKERLYNKINDFLNELDNDRIQYGALSKLFVAVAHTGGEAAKELEPAWKWFKLIAEIMGVRSENEQLALPTNSPPKRIPPPKRAEPTETPKKTGRKSDFDDEIPF